jgi:hypothetical protein
MKTQVERTSKGHSISHRMPFVMHALQTRDTDKCGGLQSQCHLTNGITLSERKSTSSFEQCSFTEAFFTMKDTGRGK